MNDMYISSANWIEHNSRDIYIASYLFTHIAKLFYVQDRKLIIIGVACLNEASGES